MSKKKTSKKESYLERYIPRDLSWLDFNERVLQEAMDPEVPLIERLRFIGIFSNNMDEFFRVRYATIKRMSVFGKKASRELGGMPPDRLLAQLGEIVKTQQSNAEKTYEKLVKELEKQKIILVNEKQLTQAQKDFVRAYFVEKVSPAVFTIILDPERPIPEINDKSIYLAIKLINDNDSSKNKFALIELPTDVVDRFIELPKYGKRFVMYLDDLIRYNLNFIMFIFPFDRVEAYTIKITRDAELDMDNDVSKSFIDKMSESLEGRKVGDPVRFLYDRDIAPDLLQYLVARMNLDNYDSLTAGGRYHNKKDLISFPNIGDKNSVYEELKPLPHPDFDFDKSLLNVIAQKDVLLFQPYHMFSYFLRVLREAALDPSVKTIKVTLYRLAKKSRVISALKNAARNGKKVTVVIELQARFDEEANIKWTEELKIENIELIFGVSGLKVHSKLCLITRLENEREVDYAIIGTGNFNESTAKLYTDYQLFTADKRLTREIKKLFQFFISNYLVFRYNHIITSPHHTRLRFNDLIDQEIDHAKNGLPAAITLKCNSLSDTGIIEKLYEASAAGVKIKLIVRGICSIIAGKPGLSDNIEAISVIDRYLEHSRVYVFENAGDRKYYISSADMMTRNIDYRVEVTAPIYDKNLQKQLQDHLDIIWKDNVKARWHNPYQKNEYRKINGPKIRSQYELYNYVKKQSRNSNY